MATWLVIACLASRPCLLAVKCLRTDSTSQAYCVPHTRCSDCNLCHVPSPHCACCEAASYLGLASHQAVCTLCELYVHHGTCRCMLANNPQPVCHQAVICGRQALLRSFEMVCSLRECCMKNRAYGLTVKGKGDFVVIRALLTSWVWQGNSYLNQL